jgi:hypothetical protein
MGAPPRHPLQFAAADQQVERHADVGKQHDDQQPREGVARLPSLAEQAGDREYGQQEPPDGKEVRSDAGGQHIPGAGGQRWHLGAMQCDSRPAATPDGRGSFRPSGRKVVVGPGFEPGKGEAQEIYSLSSLAT